MKCFPYADQNHTYSNLLHLIYHIANYLELRHVVSNSHRGTVKHSNLSADKNFPRKLFFIYCAFIGPCQSNDYTSPSVWGLTLLKIDLVSARHLMEGSQVVETCSQDIRNTFQMQW